MAHIQVLDQKTIDRIAAGEVVERPASIVKELVENAIDAGATVITVEIEEGGISLIRVADNGTGIPKEDVQNAFLRHATSKIRDAEDLQHILSLGFRGEALSSIAAVSQIELVTKVRDKSFGIRYLIEGGSERLFEETGAPQGTVFTIRNLFYNVPARKKFLKSSMTEASHVQDVMIRMAQAHEEISFKLQVKGQTKLETGGSGNLKDVIYHLYGRDIAANILPVEIHTDLLSVTGFIGKPLIARGNRKLLNYDLNGRYFESKIIYKAIEDAYRPYMMQHKYPFCSLHLVMEPEMVDVNVHPGKMEVRFRSGQEVYGCLLDGLEKVLRAREMLPRLMDGEEAEKPAYAGAPDKKTEPAESPAPEDMKVEKAVQDAPKDVKSEKTVRDAPEDTKVEKTVRDAPEDTKVEKTVRDASEDTKFETPSAETKRMGIPSVETLSRDPETLYYLKEMRKRVDAYHEKPAPQADTPKQTFSDSQFVKSDETFFLMEEPEQLSFSEEKILTPEHRREFQIIGQVFKTYWLVQWRERLLIIDQHAAHEKVLFEKIVKKLDAEGLPSQILAIPIILHLSMGEQLALSEHMEDFRHMGFEIEAFGGDDYAVRAVPMELSHIADRELLLEMLDDFHESMGKQSMTQSTRLKLATQACKAAVKGNRSLSTKEMEALLDELLVMENPYHCPHGRPTMIEMSKTELEKKFKRIV